MLLGDLNWNMLNTPAILQSKLDALNLTQIINEPTRYHPKAVNTGTLIDHPDQPALQIHLKSNQIVFVTYTWLADVNANVAKCLCF